MAILQERLENVKKQQERCQATLMISITEQQNPINFSKDTERLQQINNIRKGPVGAQIKRVVDLLYERRQALDPEEINRDCYVDLHANKAVFDSLKKNPKLKYDGSRFSYKPSHNIRNKDQLLDLIRKFQDGVGVIDLKDSYSNVMQDLESLKGAGQIWILYKFDSKEDFVVYPNDPRVSIRVDDDLKQFFRGIETPSDVIDMEKDLQKNGMKPATNTAKRRAIAQALHGISNKPKTKKKKLEISKRTKLTNSHLMHLFQ
ncbi:OLC1v1023617C1 [Oldenlandia corymbosa var. corymbosa]|uniref:OLC1v1023617C1 n=1 Tax=Oldenlandia corymbosa var. corymbosa TaxID=529605 RepID=A0AAV1C359_OLDCO|nr:OLC1v1023617C1 [Oldenlandia corymbosa var. corymbosa]